MDVNERTPALAGDRGSEDRLAWRRDDSESTRILPKFQWIGYIAATIIARLKRENAAAIGANALEEVAR